MNIPIKQKPIWRLPKGHAEHRSGAGVMADKRTKRQKTRQTQNKQAIRESEG